MDFATRNKIINETGKDILDFAKSERSAIYQRYLKEPLQNLKSNIEHPYRQLGWLGGNPFISYSNFDDTGLKAYWKFDEASGNIINVSNSGVDLGSAADITMTGGTYSQSGKVGTSVLFNGSGDKGVVGSSTSQFNFMHNTTALWSMNFWIKFAVNDSEDAIFATNPSGSSTQNGVWLYKTGVADEFAFAMTGAAGYVVTNAATGQTATDTNWHMFTLLYDQSLGSNNLTAYKDGSSVGNMSKTANSPSNTNANGAMKVMGDMASLAGDTNAYVDEWSIFNRILSSAEITYLYNSGNGRAIY